MAYDAATGNVVLYGGQNYHQILGGTWSWNGTTWTQQSSKRPGPGSRVLASMAYDAATGNMVMFGGTGPGGNREYLFRGTWTWDGTTWTKQSPATHPLPRFDAAMAYDPATSNVVLFGGLGGGASILGDTWTWG